MEYINSLKKHNAYQIITLQSICSDEETKELVQTIPGLKDDSSCSVSSIKEVKCAFKFAGNRYEKYCDHVYCSILPRKDGIRVRYVLVKYRIYLRN